MFLERVNFQWFIFLLIWHLVVWSIWFARNDLVFYDKAVDIKQLVDKIQFTYLFVFCIPPLLFFGVRLCLIFFLFCH